MPVPSSACSGCSLRCDGLPRLVLGKPEACIRGLLKLPLMIGGVHAHIQPSSTTRHVAYAKKQNNTVQRVAFLTNIVSPYRKPVFASLAQARNIDLRIFVDAQSEFDRDWTVATEDLPIEQTRSLCWKQTEVSEGSTRFTQRLTKHFPYGLPVQLFRFKPKVVISLELGFRTAFAALYCKLTGTKLVIWSYQSRERGPKQHAQAMARSLVKTGFHGGRHGHPSPSSAAQLGRAGGQNHRCAQRRRPRRILAGAQQRQRRTRDSMLACSTCAQAKARAGRRTPHPPQGHRAHTRELERTSPKTKAQWKLVFVGMALWID